MLKALNTTRRWFTFASKRLKAQLVWSSQNKCFKGAPHVTGHEVYSCRKARRMNSSALPKAGRSRKRSALEIRFSDHRITQ